jgi:hypothetical protein
MVYYLSHAKSRVSVEEGQAEDWEARELGFRALLLRRDEVRHEPVRIHGGQLRRGNRARPIGRMAGRRSS